MSLLQRLIILSHRYLGLVLGPIVIVWFASGIVMLYAGGMPQVTPEMRLARLPPLDLAQVRLTPAEAADRAALASARGASGEAGRLLLTTVMDRPAYRIGRATVFADTGALLRTATLEDSRAVAARFAGVPETGVAHVETLARVDQWTLGQGRALPLHKFRIDDGDGTEVYVQPRTGDVVMATTRRTRALAWAGAIPHWLYFTVLRQNQPLWYRLVVWTSAAACALSLLGLVLAVTRWRRVTPFRLSRAIRYSGLMRWHYVTGAVFGVFTVTWAFSGLLSMEPFAWTTATGLDVRRDALTGGPVNPAAFGPIDPAAWARALGGRAVAEIEFVRVLDEHYYAVQLAPAAEGESRRPERLHQPYYVTARGEPDRVLLRAETLERRHQPFSAESMIVRLGSSVPEAPIVEARVLSDYDTYYYSRGRLRPLPILRVKFGDPAATWVYVDPEMGRIVAQVHRLNRVERWLYNGLHSLDFPFWYTRRPLWDIGMLILLLGGLAASGFGFAMGLRRLGRAAGRTVRSHVDTPLRVPAGAVSSPAGHTSAVSPRR